MVAAVAIARREGRLMTPPSQTRRGQKGPGRMAKKMSDETSDALSTSSGPKKKKYSHRRRKKTERSERRERGSEERGSEERGEGAGGEGGGVGPGGS